MLAGGARSEHRNSSERNLPGGANMSSGSEDDSYGYDFEDNEDGGGDRRDSDVSGEEGSGGNGRGEEGSGEEGSGDRGGRVRGGGGGRDRRDGGGEDRGDGGIGREGGGGGRGPRDGGGEYRSGRGGRGRGDAILSVKTPQNKTLATLKKTPSTRDAALLASKRIPKKADDDSASADDSHDPSYDEDEDADVDEDDEEDDVDGKVVVY